MIQNLLKIASELMPHHECASLETAGHQLKMKSERECLKVGLGSCDQGRPGSLGCKRNPSPRRCIPRHRKVIFEPPRLRFDTATELSSDPFIRTEIGTLEQRSGRSICRVVGRNVDQSAKRQMTLGDPLLNK
jgi:hypothetical protein